MIWLLYCALYTSASDLHSPSRDRTKDGKNAHHSASKMGRHSRDMDMPDMDGDRPDMRGGSKIARRAASKDMDHDMPDMNADVAHLHGMSNDIAIARSDETNTHAKEPMSSTKRPWVQPVATTTSASEDIQEEVGVNTIASDGIDPLLQNGTAFKEEENNEEGFAARKETCHETCADLCTVTHLCAKEETDNRRAWIDPRWKQTWYDTKFNRFTGRLALGDAFHYPTSRAPKYTQYKWLMPTSEDGGDVDFAPQQFTKTKVTHIQANFQKWFDSQGNLTARGNFTHYTTIPVGGQRMRDQDTNFTHVGNKPCVKRCDIWCRQACECNWAWDFSWAGTRDVGWKHKVPMRFRWVSPAPYRGTWKCVDPQGVALQAPYDVPSWSLDIYSDEVKKEVNTGALDLHLTCDHVKRIYAKVIYAKPQCRDGLRPCEFDCKKAADLVVGFAKENNMLKEVYMKSQNGSNTLIADMTSGIAHNCRRTCAEAHKPDFREHYPEIVIESHIA